MSAPSPPHNTQGALNPGNPGFHQLEEPWRLGKKEGRAREWSDLGLSEQWGDMERRNFWGRWQGGHHP